MKLFIFLMTALGVVVAVSFFGLGVFSVGAGVAWSLHILILGSGLAGVGPTIAALVTILIGIAVAVIAAIGVWAALQRRLDRLLVYAWE